MPNPKISTCVDAFTASAINTTLWGTITGGAATLDTVNDQVTLAVPTASGGINTFGTTTLFDATGSSLYAMVGVAANGNGGTKSILRLRLDANNAMTMRIESGVFKQVQVSGGTTTSITLPAYDPHAHRWWRLRESAAVFYADTSPDGLNWTNLSSMAYTWDATQVTVRFESQASVTEVSGNATVIAHVNTRDGGQPNLDWPRMEHGAGLFWGANGGAVPRDLYVDVSKRTNGTATVNRGVQYEMDSVRAGEESTKLMNADGVLDPTSATSPFAGSVQPFQPYRIRAQWPPTANLASQGIASGGDAAGIAAGTITPSDVLDLASDTDSTGGSVVASATAWLGANVTQFSVPNATAAGQRVAHSAQIAVRPGQAYTLQLRVRNVTASTSLQVKPLIGWYSVGSQTPSAYTYGTTQTLTGSATAAWTYLTASGTAPAGTYGIDIGVATAATAGALCSVQTDGWQTEEGLTASAWVMPGKWEGIYAGFTEDWKSVWELGGLFGTVTASAADAISLLSQLDLTDPLSQELNAHSPRYIYTLADPAGATSATDLTGSFPALPLQASKYGAGTTSFGNAITGVSPTGVYTGATGTVLTLTNPNPGTATATNPTSFLNLKAAGILGPVSPLFTRMIAFRYPSPAPTTEAELWTAMDANAGVIPDGELRCYIDSSGHVNLIMTSFANSGLSLSLPNAVADGNWHLVLFGQDTATKRLFLSVDGAFTDADASGGGGPYPFFPLNLVSDSVGAATYPVGSANYSFKGDLSYVAELATALTSTDCTNLYTAWRSAAAGESSGARYARILRYAGYTGTSALATGLTTSMGPANIAGQNVMTALQAVVETENGQHYVARDGAVTFWGRDKRYDSLAPVYTFGEKADLGEWPYEDCQPVWDSTHLGNKIAVTQESTGQVFYAQDAASIAAYFPRTMTRTVNSTNALEVQDAANYLKTRYKLPLNRLVSVVLHPSANPAMWPVCLALELGTRIRVMRRPPGVTATQIDCFVENLSWSISDNNDVTVTLQCSPADLTPYGIYAAWHTTLKTTVASGVSSITVNASADTTNPLAAQLGQGQQIVLGQNTANQETVTVLSVGTTSPGWTSAVITLTAPTTKGHTAGDLINEPLPAGTTDPTTWDTNVYDAVAYAY